MKKKKYIIWITALILVIAVICLIVILIINNSGESDTQQLTEKERIFWNDFLHEHPYTAEIEYIYSDTKLMEYSELIKIALSSDSIKAEEVLNEEKKENVLLVAENTYKKPKKEVESYLKKYFGVEDIQYDSAGIYVADDGFIILGEDYIYYTEINLLEKFFIATKYEQEGEDYIVEINEYIVTEENNEQLETILETGEINKDIHINNSYTITGKKIGDNVQIISKYPNKGETGVPDELPKPEVLDVKIIKSLDK